MIANFFITPGLFELIPDNCENTNIQELVRIVGEHFCFALAFLL